MIKITPKRLAISGVVLLLPIASLFAVVITPLSEKACAINNSTLRFLKFLFCEIPNYTGTRLNLIEDTLSVLTGLGALLLIAAIFLKVKRSVKLHGLIRKPLLIILTTILILGSLITLVVAGIIPLPERCKMTSSDTGICYGFLQSEFWEQKEIKLEWDYVNI